MKQLQIAGQNYTVGPMTLRQMIVLQACFTLWQRLVPAHAAVDIKKVGPTEAKALAEAVAAVLQIEANAVLDWPLAQTISAAALAGQAFLEVNGPYLTAEVVPAIERLTAFAATLNAALQTKAAQPQ